MKAIILSAVLVMAGVSQVRAWQGSASPNYEEYTSRVFQQNQGITAAKVSTGVVTFGYYQVLSTGTPTDSLNIFDAYNSSSQVGPVSVSTGFPVNVIGVFPLDITCSTGAYVTVESVSATPVRVRVKYKIEQKY